MHLVFYLNIVIYATSLSQAALLTKLNSDGKFKLTDFKFNLNSLNPNEGSGGGQIRALTVDQMPTLKDTGVSIILIDIEACGVNLPNSHPRAAEIVYVISAENLVAGFINENGMEVVNKLKTGEVTLFPKGLVHFIQNIGCTPARLLTSLGSEDPGFITLSKAEFTLPYQVLESNFKLSKEKLETIKSSLPSSLAIGNKECLQRCGLK